ncbi:MAG: hypothetical protein FWG65_06530 [Turicibacter sp.]|nr:hypothetical protein [Turicibacter sp.]
MVAFAAILFGMLVLYSARFFIQSEAVGVCIKALGEERYFKIMDELNAYKFSCFVGVSVFVKGICIITMFVAIEWGMRWLNAVSAVIFIFVTVGYFRYVREYVVTGLHFRQRKE